MPVVPVGAGGAMTTHQILADQLTLSEQEEADYAHQIILVPADIQTFLRPWNWKYSIQ
jgi:hypothetical protein